MEVPQVLYSARDTAKILGISKSFVYILMDRGEMESIRFGRTRRIAAHEINRFMDEHVVEHAA